MDVEALVDAVDAELQADGRPERAEQEAAYLRSRLTHYGTSVPDTRAVMKALLARQSLTHDQLIAVVTLLWGEPEHPVHERRLAAALLLALAHARIELGDVPLIERMIRESRTWALSDVLSGDALGPAFDRMAEQDPVTAILDRWAEDEDLWIRRGALLVHQRPLRRGGGDWERFTRYADAMLDEKEFFVRKAIGWMLREAGRFRADEVCAWLLPRAGRASSITLKEAVKKLSPEQRDAVLQRRS